MKSTIALRNNLSGFISRASTAQCPAEMCKLALHTSSVLLIKLGRAGWLKWSPCCFTCPFMSLKRIHNKHCQRFVPSCLNQMFLYPGLLLWKTGGQVGILSAGVNWRLASFGIAQSCAFVRSQSASLTADPEPRHQKVKAQLLCGCCRSVSHGMGRDNPADPVYPLESSLSERSLGCSALPY